MRKKTETDSTMPYFFPYPYTFTVYLDDSDLPNTAGLRYSHSQRNALQQVRREYDCARLLFDADLTSFKALLWCGDFDDITDIRPDYVLKIGRRGGLTWTPNPQRRPGP